MPVTLKIAFLHETIYLAGISCGKIPDLKISKSKMLAGFVSYHWQNHNQTGMR